MNPDHQQRLKALDFRERRRVFEAVQTAGTVRQCGPKTPDRPNTVNISWPGVMLYVIEDDWEQALTAEEVTDGR